MGHKGAFRCNGAQGRIPLQWGTRAHSAAMGHKVFDKFREWSQWVLNSSEFVTGVSGNHAGRATLRIRLCASGFVRISFVTSARPCTQNG
jgi:hypothetical protein